MNYYSKIHAEIFLCFCVLVVHAGTDFSCSRLVYNFIPQKINCYLSESGFMYRFSTSKTTTSTNIHGRFLVQSDLHFTAQKF